RHRKRPVRSHGRRPPRDGRVAAKGNDQPFGVSGDNTALEGPRVASPANDCKILDDRRSNRDHDGGGVGNLTPRTGFRPVPFPQGAVSGGAHPPKGGAVVVREKLPGLSVMGVPGATPVIETGRLPASRSVSRPDSVTSCCEP